MSSLGDLFVRIAAIQEELVTTSQARPYFFHTQAGFPYWTNRLLRSPVERNQGSGNITLVANVEMSYHAGKTTEGAKGKLEIGLYDIVEETLVRFYRRPELLSEAFPDDMLHLQPNSLIVSCRGTGKATAGQEEAISTIFDLQARFTLAVVNQP